MAGARVREGSPVFPPNPAALSWRLGGEPDRFPDPGAGAPAHERRLGVRAGPAERRSTVRAGAGGGCARSGW